MPPTISNFAAFSKITIRHDISIDDSHEISFLIFLTIKMSQNLSSAAVVIGALRFYKTQDAYGIDLGSQRFRPNMVT